MTANLEQGSLVRLTQDTTDLGFQNTPLPKGFEFEVEEYYVPLLEHIGDLNYIQVPFYCGNANGGYNNVCVPASVVQLVLTPKQSQGRKPPSLDVAASDISNELCGMHSDNFEIYETSVEDEGTVLMYCTTHENLDFIMTLKIEEIYKN